MSRVDISPEQRNAEAAGEAIRAAAPRADYNPMPDRPASFSAMVLVIRAEYMAEIPERLHVQYVPGRTEPIPVGEGTIDVLDTGELGSPSWAPAFHRRLGAIGLRNGVTVQRDYDLRPFPWARNLEGMRRWCSSKHQNWHEHQHRPLCWTLVSHVVIGGYLPARAGELEGVSPETADRLLQDAISKWWAWTSNDMNEIELRKTHRATA